VNDKADTVTIRDLRSGATTKRILAGETLALRMGSEVIADIVPRPLSARRTLDEVLAPVRAAARRAPRGKNLILEDRARFRR
jgi:hypothetical protein